MKSLRQGVNEYLEYRWQLGFKLQNEKFLLASFASFMELNRAKHITAKLALTFATMNPESQSITYAQRLRIIRKFALYWSAIDPKTEIPLKNLLPGVDGVIWKTDNQKINAAYALKRKGYQAQPLRRIHIPKRMGKRARSECPQNQTEANKFYTYLV